MKPFIPIMQGQFSAKAVNNRLRQLHAEIDALKALIRGDVEEVIEIATEAATSTSDSAETTFIEDAVSDIGVTADNWRTCEDIDALKAFALESFNLTVRARKIETVKAEIDGFLESQMMG